MPFKDHPDFVNASPETRSRILSCGWIIYNQKTISIETQIINPACVSILANNIPGLRDSFCKKVVSETMVDESYHVLLVSDAIEITSQKRNLFLECPMFKLIENMKMFQLAYSSKLKKNLILIATAIVSEIFISDYLKLLSENKTIQPFNRITTKIHRDDELAHSNIFRHLTKYLYASLDSEEKGFFSEILPKPVRWFANRELKVWETVLEQIGFRNTAKMIMDCKHNYTECLNHIDYSKLISLAEETGMLDFSRGSDSFHKEGLIDKKYAKLQTSSCH